MALFKDMESVMMQFDDKNIWKPRQVDEVIANLKGTVNVLSFDSLIN